MGSCYDLLVRPLPIV